MMITFRHQRGATLLISLIMLVVLTLFAVAGFNLSSVNLKIAGNFQAQRGMEAVAQQAIEQVLSTSAAFKAPAVQTIAISGFNVAVTAATCNFFRRADGFSKELEAIAPEDTDWELRASVTDALTGAQATVTQGVMVRLPKDNCL